MQGVPGGKQGVPEGYAKEFWEVSKEFLEVRM
jgi:hypothetical protein